MTNVCIYPDCNCPIDKNGICVRGLPEPGEAPSKYHRNIKGVYVDVYDIIHAYGITNPGDQHAIKKMLQPGKRGYKDARQDREEAIVSLRRANELEEK